MSTTLSTTTKPQTEATLSTALPEGTRVRAVRLSPSTIHDQYHGKIGTVVSSQAHSAPLVRFEPMPGWADWYVVEWQVLPQVGQKVTVAECLPLANEDFRSSMIGRSATYLRTDGEHHVVQFDEMPNEDWANPCAVAVLDFEMGFTPSEVEVDPEVLYEERERIARETLDRLYQALNDLAENQDWCGQFESWCEEHDVPVTRQCEKEYNVDIMLTYRISSSQIEEMFAEHFGGEHYNISADDVDVESTVTITMTLTGEDPSEVEGWRITTLLEENGYSGFEDYDVSDWSEI